jgi:SAM-dependent methyltransferase
MGAELAPLAEQLAYYRAVAAEYSTRSIDAPGFDELMTAIDSFRPTGDVLELACGPGTLTERLARSAASVTAIDAAPEMLAYARARLVGATTVRLVEADVFAWRPDRRYDAVCFGFWISHVPEERFESFWALVEAALSADGEVFFGPASPIVQRRLEDATSFQVLKIPYEPAALEARLSQLGWRIAVTPTSGPFYWGTGTREELPAASAADPSTGESPEP